MHDSLGYVKSLESAGISTKQAEAQVQMMTDIINSELATRQDIRDVRAEIRETTIQLRSEMKEMGNQLRSEMKEMETRLSLDMAGIRSDVRAVEDRMTIRLGSMMIAGVGVILTAFGGLAAFIHFVH